MLVTVLYAWLAIWTPIRELAAATLDPGRRTPWVGIGRRAAVGLAMLCALWLEGRIFGHLFVARAPASFGLGASDGSAASVVDAVAWSILLLPLALLAVVFLLLHLLRRQLL
jgi:hypothetical protein